MKSGQKHVGRYNLSLSDVKKPDYLLEGIKIKPDGENHILILETKDTLSNEKHTSMIFCEKGESIFKILLRVKKEFIQVGG